MDQLRKFVKNMKRWVASDVINEEIGLRLRAMAIVFPDFAKQLAAAGSAAEAKRLLALAEADAARKALAAAEVKRIAAEELAANVAILSK